MKTISESITTMEGAIPTLQDRIMYNHFDSGVQPIIFQDAIIKKMDLTTPQPPAVPIIPTPHINNNIIPQVQYTQQPQSSIPVLDLKPVDPCSVYYTEPSSNPSAENNIKDNMKFLSGYFDLSYDEIVTGDIECDQYFINALEILKLRILNEKKVLNEFCKFVRQFNPDNEESKRMVQDAVPIGENFTYFYFESDNVNFYIKVCDVKNIKYEKSSDGKLYCTNKIEFHTCPH